MNISEKKACKDLQEMIDNGMFGEDAFIDMKSRTLVMSMDSLDEMPDIENIVNDDYDTTLFNSKQAKKFDRDNKAMRQPLEYKPAFQQAPAPPPISQNGIVPVWLPLLPQKFPHPLNPLHSAAVPSEIG